MSWTAHDGPSVVFWVDGAFGVQTTICDDATGMIYVAAMDQMMTEAEYIAWRKKIAKMDRKANYMRTYRARKKAEKCIG